MLRSVKGSVLRQKSSTGFNGSVTLKPQDLRKNNEDYKRLENVKNFLPLAKQDRDESSLVGRF